MALFPSAGRVPLLIVMSSNRARYGIIAFPTSFGISVEIPFGLIDVFPIAATLLLIILVSMV